jgi:hypothetical protein
MGVSEHYALVPAAQGHLWCQSKRQTVFTDNLRNDRNTPRVK